MAINNWKTDGATIPYTPGSAVTAGAVTVHSGATAGKIVSIAPYDIAANTPGSVAVSGLFEVNAKSTDVFAIGEKLYWDSGNSEFTLTSSGNTLAGFAAAAKASGSTRASLLLNFNGI